MQKESTIFVNLAKLRGQIIYALHFSKEGCLDIDTKEAICRSLNEALRLISLVEDEALAQ
jgi:hypothetical protein